MELFFADLQKQRSHCNEEDYGGPEALSEIETQHIIQNFRANAPIIGAIDMHSYGDLILRPWGESNETAPDESFHRDVGRSMVDLIKDVSHMTGSHDRVTCI